uniref:Putative secreted protein n=1 Tax=Anopheles marajoara TaxID=58244 RepID=A0A2M4CDM5_9DIPT
MLTVSFFSWFSCCFSAISNFEAVFTERALYCLLVCSRRFLNERVSVRKPVLLMFIRAFTISVSPDIKSHRRLL